MHFKKIAAAFVLAASSLCVSAAGNWPSQPIRLVVPYPPGGANDKIGRIVAHELESRLKVSVVVDNKGGAGGSIGVTLVKQAVPDGYTIGVVPSGPLDVNPSLMPNLSYDIKDFTYIGPAVKIPLFLAVSPKSGIKSLQDLIAKAKANPNSVTYSSAGVGNSTHLAGALLAHMTGTRMTHVPYRGAGPAAMAVLSNEVTFTFGSGPSVLQYVKAGSLVGLGTSVPARVETEPDVPTIAEQGIAGFDVSPWAGIIAPANLPPAIAQKLTSTLREIMQSPSVRKQVLPDGMFPVIGSGEDFEKTVRSDARKWGKLITDAGITTQ